VRRRDATSALVAKRARSFLADDFFDASQDGVAIHHRRRRVIEDPLLADHTLRVNEKKRPYRGQYLLVEDSISPDHFPFGEVAQQRVRQL
jgi:hypothetical protein